MLSLLISSDEWKESIWYVYQQKLSWLFFFYSRGSRVGVNAKVCLGTTDIFFNIFLLGCRLDKIRGGRVNYLAASGHRWVWFKIPKNISKSLSLLYYVSFDSLWVFPCLQDETRKEKGRALCSPNVTRSPARQDDSTFSHDSRDRKTNLSSFRRYNSFRFILFWLLSEIAPRLSNVPERIEYERHFKSFQGKQNIARESRRQEDTVVSSDTYPTSLMRRRRCRPS